MKCLQKQNKQNNNKGLSFAEVINTSIRFTDSTSKLQIAFKLIKINPFQMVHTAETLKIKKKNVVNYISTNGQSPVSTTKVESLT